MRRQKEKEYGTPDFDLWQEWKNGKLRHVPDEKKRTEPEASDMRFAWTRFYEAVADKLLGFKDKRDELVEGIHQIVSRVDFLSGYEDRYRDGTTGPLKDICPFTTMGTFTRKHTFENRNIIATELAGLLGVNESAPDSFDGIPILPYAGWFFNHEKDRGTDDIDKLWKIFEEAIRLAESENKDNRSAFITAYDNALQCSGVAWNLTMGLYWIRPWNFPTLDKSSRDYMKKTNILDIEIPNKVPNAKNYLEILDTLKARFQEDEYPVRSFPELAITAWLSDQDPPPTSSFPKPKPRPTNLILYGPPGTGKTYRLNEWKKEYSSGEQAPSRKVWLSQELSDARWFDVIFCALYDLGGEAKVGEIHKHEYVLAKADMGHGKHVRATIWSVLQKHTRENSDTVKFKNRGNYPSVFDKNPHAVWHLVDDWEEECGEQVKLAKSWKNGPKQKSTHERFEFVTFHQAYSYEDFVEGIRPVHDEETDSMAYKIAPGVFKRICRKAEADPGQRYAIFIDEINRGNIASIFGELITLIEPDKRTAYEDDGSGKPEGMTLTLPYSRERFGVPANLDIYGTMNTADRSIALLDTALRRRFEFQELMPDASVISGSTGDGRIEDGEGGYIDLRVLFEAINSRISFLLNRDMTIGHSYLINVRDFEGLREVLLSRIIPLLQEYFYEDWHRIQLVFRDVRQGGEALRPQIIHHYRLSEEKIIGFDHEDFEDSVEYRVANEDEITPEAIRKVYEENNGGNSASS